MAEDQLRAWAADKVERWPLDRILPYDKNPRTHSEDQVRQLADSMRRFGVTTPVLVDEAGVLIYGHGRVAAARLAGLAELPVCIASGWSETDKRAYRLADNQLALTSGWDLPLLKHELQALKLDGFDLPALGFDAPQLVQFMANPASQDPEAAPEPPAQPVSRPGDIWLLGNHRLMCGDCTNSEQMMALYDGERPHLLVSDPPYGVEYDPGWRVVVGVRATGLVTNDDRADWTVVWEQCGCDILYVWHAGNNAGVVDRSLRQAAYEPRVQIIWRKPYFAIGRGDYHWQHECCYYSIRRNEKSHWNGDRKQTTVWDIASHIQKEGENARTDHGTQKPVECMRRPMENNSKPGDLVYDPFVGSGTTIIAAELSARRCLAMEISPVYCDVALLRWQKIAGKEATLKSDGRAFDEVAAERLRGNGKSGAIPDRPGKSSRARPSPSAK